MKHQYLDYLRSVRNLTENTVLAYGKDLARFFDFLKDRNLTEENVDLAVARSFVARLSASGLSAVSVNRVVSAVRGYYKFKQREGGVDQNPFSVLRSLKKEKKLPSFLFEDEVQLLMEPGDTDFFCCRNRAMFEFLYSTGCRVSEMTGVNVMDLNLKKGMVLVKGKGRKERFVFIGKKADQALRDWLLKRDSHVDRKDDDAARALFINKNGGRLSVRGVRWVLDKRIRELSLTKKVSPHTLRHSFATHIINKGADIRVVQELLGHASLGTTQIYTHVSLDKLKKIYQDAHPHAHFEG